MRKPTSGTIVSRGNATSHILASAAVPVSGRSPHPLAVVQMLAADGDLLGEQNEVQMRRGFHHGRLDADSSQRLY